MSKAGGGLYLQKEKSENGKKDRVPRGYISRRSWAFRSAIER
jgi:hypothetical protein